MSKTLGRPSKYNEGIQKRADKYISAIVVTGKILTLEGLALHLDVCTDRLKRWADAKDKKGRYKYPIFRRTYTRVMHLQRDWLIKKGVELSEVKGTNSNFLQFLLKANHGMIEAEKHILAGDKDNPSPIKIGIMSSDIQPNRETSPVIEGTEDEEI